MGVDAAFNNAMELILLHIHLGLRGDFVRKVVLGVLLCLQMCCAGNAWGLDVLKMEVSESPRDPRSYFAQELFSLIMQATQEDFGPYTIWQFHYTTTSQDRVLAELVDGVRSNAGVQAARAAWEEQTIPIRIPVLKGMLGIRLFFIRKDHEALFRDVRTLDDLKRVRMGSGHAWTITRALEAEGFNMVPGTSYEGLFRMLDGNRFDCFPRGLTEIYYEQEARKDEYPEMIIEPTMAMIMPLPSFIFVSPKEPRLAKRMEAGLKRVMANGTYDELFEKYYGDMLQRARLDQRRVFHVPNPALTPETQRVLDAQ